MQKLNVLVLTGLVVAAGVPGQQSASPQGGAAKTAEPPEIYQIDLVPTGSGFALTKPVLEGDVYVFQVWPDRSTVRLPKSKVKKMAPRTKDVSNEVVWQIDLAPTGQIFARDNPTLKGTTYVFHRWSGGALMSVRQSDVKKITRVAGLDAFKIHLQHFGAKSIDNLPMEGGTASMAPPPEAPPGSDAVPPGQPTNWIYFGLPGVTDAWAPPPAVVSAPGDVPRAPDPQPHL